MDKLKQLIKGEGDYALYVYSDNQYPDPSHTVNLTLLFFSPDGKVFGAYDAYGGDIKYGSNDNEIDEDADESMSIEDEDTDESISSEDEDEDEYEDECIISAEEIFDLHAHRLHSQPEHPSFLRGEVILDDTNPKDLRIRFSVNSQDGKRSFVYEGGFAKEAGFAKIIDCEVESSLILASNHLYDAYPIAAYYYAGMVKDGKIQYDKSFQEMTYEEGFYSDVELELAESEFLKLGSDMKLNVVRTSIFPSDEDKLKTFISHLTEGEIFSLLNSLKKEHAQLMLEKAGKESFEKFPSIQQWFQNIEG